LLLPLSHTLQLARNHAVLPELSRKAYPHWLLKAETADASLEQLYRKVVSGEPLRCADAGHNCRYSELYGALQQLHRARTGEDNLAIRAEDPRSGEIITVDRALWASWYWKH